jgi:hypothetical protein
MFKGLTDTVNEINTRYKTPRIKMTKGVTFALLILRVYLFILLALLLYKFIMIVGGH